MPLDTIYLTRHGHRLTFSLDLTTGEYKTVYPTPTGIPVDPSLTSAGVRQSHELAAHLNSWEFSPKPSRIYCSAFYRCLQTIRPTVEALKEAKKVEKEKGAEQDGFADFDVRVENGLGEWFGSTSTFTHPAPPTRAILQTHFPTILDPESSYKARIHPPLSGESIAQLHDRVASTLRTIIADVDAEIAAYERAHPETENQSRAILICSHAAPLIAMGRVLTGVMPADSSEEDFNVFTAGLSTFVRKGRDEKDPAGSVSDWRNGKGVGGGWDCIANGDCRFLSGGAERGWHFNGEEDFNSMPNAPTPPDGQTNGSADVETASSSKL